MTSLFDGMAEVLSDVFGAPVAVEPVQGAGTDIQAVFRREPIEVEGDDGAPVLILSPTLQVSQSVALQRNDEVLPSVSPGERFRVANSQRTRSPASDGFVIYELELVE